MDKHLNSDPPAMAGIGHLSDIGQAGTSEPNQESYSLPVGVSGELASKGWLFCVADGSSSNEGEQPGRLIAVSLIQQTYYRQRAHDIGRRLKHAVETANREIFARSGGVLFNDLSVSLVCAVVTRAGLTVTYAGDCRAYLVTPQKIRCLTQDHVIVEQSDSASDEAPDQPQASPVRLVTRSVGGMPTVDLDCKTFAFQPDTHIVLCTPGLTNVVSDNELREIASSGEPQAAARRLVALAKERGSTHDITVVVVDPSVLLGKQTPAFPYWHTIGIANPIVARLGLVLLVTAAVAVLGASVSGLTASIAGRPSAGPPTSAAPATSAPAAAPIAAFTRSTSTATATPKAMDTPTNAPSPTSTATPTPTSTSTMEPASSPTSSPLPTDTPRPSTPSLAATAILPPTINVAGPWVHNFGTMNLTQSGTTVAGDYFNAFANANGRITGTRTGSVINGSWTIGGDSGVFQWTMSAGAQTFTGSWGGRVLWCGARSGQTLPPNCGYSGRWNIRLNNDTHTMNLTQTGASVSGKYFNGGANGTIDGTIGYSGNEVVLTGTWHVGSESGPLHFYYNDFPSDRFRGNYNTTSEWCGWRDTATQPSPCLK